MSDVVVQGTNVRMRVIKRYSHYNVGDLIAVEFFAARELAAKRLAQPLDLLVPVPVVAAGQDGSLPPSSGPLRQPTGVVRK
jgi:hypothetical protein